MKNLVLTGISSECSFERPEQGPAYKIGHTSFFLVFNNGELRIPTTEEGAAIAIRIACEDEGAPIRGVPKEQSHMDDRQELLEEEDEDGASQI